MIIIRKISRRLQNDYDMYTNNKFHAYIFCITGFAFTLIMLNAQIDEKVVKPVYRIFGKRCYLFETQIE